MKEHSISRQHPSPAEKFIAKKAADLGWIRCEKCSKPQWAVYHEPGKCQLPQGSDG